jgi:hypothetical protein
VGHSKLRLKFRPYNYSRLKQSLRIINSLLLLKFNRVKMGLLSVLWALVSLLIKEAIWAPELVLYAISSRNESILRDRRAISSQKCSLK